MFDEKPERMDQVQYRPGFEYETKAKLGFGYLGDDDEDDQSDVLQEHQSLIKQMRLELKSSRNGGGLSTISEESETTVENLKAKPLEFDRRIGYKDILHQVQMFYRSYTEKMKKLDILNYQTLQAINFVQMKDSELLFPVKIKKKPDFCLPKTWSCSIRKVHHDPLQRPISKLDHDLELVYVGQLCLSWETLRWLSEKTCELIDYDPQLSRSYNRAAEGFQLFQVVLQRFMEDEQVQRHRVQSYVSSRNTINTLLHVPNIKNDCSSSRGEETHSNDAITIKELSEIIIDSKAIFRDFVMTDKSSDTANTKKVHVSSTLTHAENMELLMDTITTLRKKERRVKECIKNGRSCIVNNKMKKTKKKFVEDEALTCEVELKLVNRVLRVSRLTREQLLWCQRKLENVKFVEGEAYLEDSFSLFPF